MIVNFTVKEHQQGTTLQSFLRSEGVSLALIKRIKFLPDGILVNGTKQNTDYRVNTGEQVTVNAADTQENAEKSTVIPQDMPLDIVYMDPCCMVVDKPFYMPVHPSFNHPTDTLANGFCSYWQKRGESRIFRAINRLDRNTSGLVLVALDAFSAEKLKGDVDKTYTAIVQGRVQPAQGVIELPIAREKESIITRCVREDGQYARTDYTVVKQNEKFSLLDIKLHTGRTHQIRVHFSHLGHPLAGDDLYGGSTECISRHALHCRRLEFISPHTGEKVTVNSNIPADMEEIVINL
ncbi:MAG: RluA family pseudouridine synthase [Oscillospiraceae bacterium]|nr:RluA family pseudouridine synthase [Oscillospiraceae bacterium]